MARPQDPQITARLLDRTADSLLNRGLHGLTLRPLASDLGVSPRTLLYHFDNKENLIVEAIRHLRRRRPAIKELLEERDALREVLKVLVNWTPSADTYRRLGFNPEVPMRAHDVAKDLLAKGNKA